MTNTSSEKIKAALPVTIALIVFTGMIASLWALLTIFPSFTGAITPKESALTDLGNAIVVFSFAALALQSSMGIFISNWRGEEKTRKNRRVDNFKKEIAELKAQINPSPVVTKDDIQAESSTPSLQPPQPLTPVIVVTLEPEELEKKKTELENLKQQLELAEIDLGKYRDETKTVVSRLSLAAGILVSLAGVRILQSFADVSLLGKQLSLFNTIDVLLTGGLLAGGSEGVYRLTKVYENVTDVKKQVSN